MTLQTPLHMMFGGEPVVGVVPAQLIVHGDLTQLQKGFVQARFNQFCTTTRLSIAPSMTLNCTLPDGSKMRASSIFGVRSVQVWPVGGEGRNASGIGMKLIGWDGSPIAQLRGYWLVFYAGEKWRAQAMTELVGANAPWVNEGRTDWLASEFTGGQKSVYSRNRRVSRFPLPPGENYPSVFRASKRTGSASGISTLQSTSDGAIKLYQKDVASGIFEEKDSISILPGVALDVLGIAGNTAIAASDSMAYKISLSPVLSISGTQVIPVLDAPSLSSDGDISFSGYQRITPTNGDPVSDALLNWSSFPDIRSKTISDSVHGVDSFAAYLALKSELEDDGILYSLIRVYEVAHFDGNPELGIISATAGAWGFPNSFTRLTKGPSEIDAMSTYTESCSGAEDSSEIIDQGVRHDGSVWRVTRDTHNSKGLSGVTVFDVASSSTNKDISFVGADTWNLPSGSVSAVTTVSETYSDETNVPWPELYGVSGSVTVSASINKTKLHFKYYDPDTDCSVFIREETNAEVVTSWTKSNTGSSPNSASTPVGDYLYGVSSPTYSATGTSVMSVCVYLGASIAYEEILSTGATSGGSVQYEPKAYSDMQFSFAADTPKPTGTFWPEQEIAYGPDVPATGFKFTAKWLYGVEPSGDLPSNDEMAEHSDWWGYIHPSGWYAQPVPVVSTNTIEREYSIDRSDTLAGINAEIFPADASDSSFSATVGAAKDAASGAVAVEIRYSHDGFPGSSRNRSRILLVSPTGVRPLSDLIKPATPGAFSTDYKTDNFLVTV